MLQHKLQCKLQLILHLVPSIITLTFYFKNFSNLTKLISYMHFQKSTALVFTEFKCNAYCMVPENIHTLTTEGIGNSRRVGVKSPRNSRGVGGLTVKLTSRWFSSIQYRPTAVVVRKLLLTDFGGTF